MKKLAVTRESTEEEIFSALVLFIHIFERDKLTYAFDKFHFGLIERYANAFTGGNVKVSYNKIKETGMTVLTLACLKFAVIRNLRKHIRFVHSDRVIVSEFMNAMYNFLIDPFVVKVFGQFVEESVGVKKSKGKRRYTQSILQTNNEVTIRGETALVPATGSVSLGTGDRPDLIVVDDVANIRTLESAVRSERQKKYIDDLFLSADQQDSSIFLFRNPNPGIDHFAEEIDRDERFEHMKIFLFDEEGNLRWKCEDDKVDSVGGKYAADDFEKDYFTYKYPNRRPPVSVEQLKKNPAFNVVFMGEKIDPSTLFIKTKQTPKNARIRQIEGVDVYVYGETKGNSIISIGTDHSMGIGRHNQSMVVIGDEKNEVLMTIESAVLRTEHFASVVNQIIGEIEAKKEAHTKIVLAPEDDGNEGTDFIRLMRREYARDYLMFRDSRSTAKKEKPSINYGYKPTETSNKRIYRNLKESIESNDFIINCPRILRDISTFSWDAYSDSRRENPWGHFDSLRATAIAYEATKKYRATSGGFSVIH